MSQLTLAKFIDKNEKMIFVLGIFLALLPLSFDTIKELNPKFAGFIAIAISIAVLLILRNFLWGQKTELSFEAILFVGCLATISGVVALLTYQIYTDMTLSFLDVVLSISYFIAGLILFEKLSTKLDKTIEKSKKARFFVNLFMLLLFIVLAISNIDKLLNNLLLYINFVIPPILTIEHEMIFFRGIYFMFFIYGVFVSGLGYFGKELFYEKLILKLFIKTKDIWKKIKEK